MQKSLSDISKEDLDEIRKMAGVFLTPKEIATVLEADHVAFTEACNTEGNEIYNAFAGGRLQSIFEVRQSVVKLAKQGSSPAQTMSMEMIRNSSMKMKDE